MQKVFDNPSQIETLVKQKYGFPDFIMMENAALAIKKLILQLKSESQKPGTPAKCLILCGKGNNGGDGYALARLLMGNLEPVVFCLEPPAAAEAKTQYEMCKKLGVKFLSKPALTKALSDSKNPPAFIIDCLYGTGFKGDLTGDAAKIVTLANQANSTRIACDIPTALAFDAHYTVTMGEHKLTLFSDKAKQVCGKIIVAPLGIDKDIFEATASPAAYLIEANDCKLPLRKNKAAHKGNFGHTVVIVGEKSGAAIICATAAMNFGSGLTSLVQKPESNLSQFQISPELMISEPGKKKGMTIPKRTSCIVYGSGIEAVTEDDLYKIAEWFNSADTAYPAAVFDAGVFGCPDFPRFLKAMDERPDARIVLTPHLLELTRFCKNLNLFPRLTVEVLAQDPQTKIKVGKKINKLFPNTTLVIKSANTFIASKEKIFIVTDGTPSLAKGGSGDVLAGMTGALLSQFYSAQDAAITACEAHALAATKHGAQSWDLSPMRLIKMMS